MSQYIKLERQETCRSQGNGTPLALTEMQTTEEIMINEYFTMIDDYMTQQDPKDPHQDPNAPKPDPEPDEPSPGSDPFPVRDPKIDPRQTPDTDPYPVSDPPIDPDVAPPAPVEDPPAGEPGSIPTYPPDVVF